MMTALDTLFYIVFVYIQLPPLHLVLFEEIHKWTADNEVDLYYEGKQYHASCQSIDHGFSIRLLHWEGHGHCYSIL